ncbi:hypothetical protein H6G27_32840 [Nostoc linckia FACHB-104]|nr:hypothetical protein [Nostoc linckia FACHB-104]
MNNLPHPFTNRKNLDLQRNMLFYRTEYIRQESEYSLGILCEWRMNNRRFCTPTKSTIWWSSPKGRRTRVQ